MFGFFFCGTKICLHFSFFAMLCVFFQLGEEPWGTLCLLASLIHEAGHLFAFAVQKTPPRELHFQLGGIRLVPPDDPLPFWGELGTLAGGGAVSLLCGGILWRLGMSEAALPHLFTGFFSLLPVPGLDGGEILSLVWSRIFPGYDRVLLFIGRGCAVLFAALAVCWSIRSRTWGGVMIAAGVMMAGMSSPPRGIGLSPKGRGRK